MTAISSAPFALSLSKDCPFFPHCTQEGQGFDKLSLNGISND